MATVLAGCISPADERLITNGIGANLHTSDLVRQTVLLEQYAANICVQANLPTRGAHTPKGGEEARCDYSKLKQVHLRNFLIQGMNDIDRRCDAYLLWLDAKRRSKGAVHKQISDTQTATGGILGFADVSTKAISIVGLAFGLLNHSVENYNSRLLLEIDGSTVSTIILTNRNKFRNNPEIYKAPSKPAVFYALRAYLRLCLPFAIEREINMVAAQGVQGITVPSPLDAAEVVAPKATDPITVTPSVVNNIGNPIGDVELKSVSLEDGIAFQSLLCIEPANGDFGPTGSETRLALKEFYTGRDFGAPGQTIAKSVHLRVLRDAVATFGSCDSAGFGNAYEVGRFSKKDGTGNRVDPVATIGLIVQALDIANLTVHQDLRGDKFDRTMIAAMHSAIPSLRMKYGLDGPDALDHQLYSAIILCVINSGEGANCK